MKKYVTIIMAIDPTTGDMCKWMGPYITAESFQDAQDYCNSNGLGYCEVDGELCGEIDEKLGGFASRLLEDGIWN